MMDSPKTAGGATVPARSVSAAQRDETRSPGQYPTMLAVSLRKLARIASASGRSSLEILTMNSASTNAPDAGGADG